MRERVGLNNDVHSDLNRDDSMRHRTMALGRMTSWLCRYDGRHPVERA